MTTHQIGEFVKDAESLRLFQQEQLILETTEKMCEAMVSKKMTRVQLAGALGKSKGYISQLLDGSANITLRTMSDVFLAMGMTAHVQACPLESFVPVLTLVHDDEPPIQEWRFRWEEQAVSKQSPPPVSASTAQGEVQGLAA